MEENLQQQKVAEAKESCTDSEMMDSAIDNVARITVEDPVSISTVAEDLPEPEVIEKVDLKPIIAVSLGSEITLDVG